MPRRRTPRNPLFIRRVRGQNHHSLRLLVFRFKLSYREMAVIAQELGVSVAPSTILGSVAASVWLACGHGDAPATPVPKAAVRSRDHRHRPALVRAVFLSLRESNS